MTMHVDQRISGIFHELLGMASNVMQTRTCRDGYIGHARTTYEKVSPELATEWGLRCLNVIRRVFGADSDYYEAFKEQSSGFGCFDNYGYVAQGLSILKAAKDDYEKGYLFDTRILIQAELFDDFLQQASHLLENAYYGPAAVIAGCVLEDGLRKLCQQNNVVLQPKTAIDRMNVELAKAGVYDTLLQKRLTALADIRNKAAHGKWNEFDAKDVEQMIQQVRLFMENCFG